MHFRYDILVNDSTHLSITVPIGPFHLPCYLSKYPTSPFHPLFIEVSHWPVPPAIYRSIILSRSTRHATYRSLTLARCTRHAIFRSILLACSTRHATYRSLPLARSTRHAIYRSILLVGSVLGRLRPPCYVSKYCLHMISLEPHLCRRAANRGGNIPHATLACCSYIIMLSRLSSASLLHA